VFFLAQKGRLPVGSPAPAVGHSAAKTARIPYFRFFSQQMTPPPRHVQQDILLGGVSEEKMAGFYAASTQLDAQDWLGENG
jgi:hypothetical protein